MTNFPDLDSIAEEIDLKHRLWQSLESIGDLSAEWQQAVLLSLDVPAVQAEVSKLSQLVMRCERSMPSSEVVQTLRSRVQTWRDVLPVIQARHRSALPAGDVVAADCCHESSHQRVSRRQPPRPTH